MIQQWYPVEGGSTQTVTLGPEASQIDDFYVEGWVDVRNVAGHTQRRRIDVYLGNPRVAAVAVPWADVPTKGWEYRIYMATLGGVIDETTP